MRRTCHRAISEPGVRAFALLEVVAALAIGVLLCGVVASGLTGAHLQARAAGWLGEGESLARNAESAWWRGATARDAETDTLRRPGWRVLLTAERPASPGAPAWEHWTFSPVSHPSQSLSFVSPGPP